LQQTILAVKCLIDIYAVTMGPTDKHYKFINSKTGYAIFYHTLKDKFSIDEIKIELEKVRIKVAVDNAIPLDTVYSEEIKEEEK
jgi:hypothetical protein